jgi:hypothetical protein
VSELCGWLEANTGVDDVLLTPPDEENIRFRCRRAIVVDWKAAPMKHSDLLAWYERIEAVSGRKPFKSAADLQGYSAMSHERLQALRQRFGFDYVVARRSAPLEIGTEPTFRGERFLAYRLSP